MNQKVASVRAEQWRQTVYDCLNRDPKLTKKQWCRENGVYYRSFLYWQHKFQVEALDLMERAGLDEKIRGEKKIVPTIVEKASKMIPDSPYLVLRGSNSELPEELAKALTEKLGYPPADIVKIGAAVSINIGPEITAILMLENR